MRNVFINKGKNERGLTLVELLAVIIILGIIAAIAVPAIGKIIENSRIKAVKSEAIIAMDVAKLYFVDHQSYADWQSASIPNLIKEGYMSEGYLTSSSYVINTHPATICAASSDGEGRKSTNVKFVNVTAEDIAKSKNEKQVGMPGDTCGDLKVTVD